MANNFSYYPFTYGRLEKDQIRLLFLSAKGGQRSLQLYHCYLASAPEFFALSYTWGNPDRTGQHIVVDGAALGVTKNLKNLLPYLSEKYQNRYFWIDGICINQDDEPEKERQLPLMGKIYSQRTAIIWLGESNECLDQAIPALPDLVQKLHGYNPRLGVNDHYFRLHGIPVQSSPIWEGLKDLMKRDWFTRVWTFQEAVLPDNIELLCGWHIIPTTSLAQLANILLLLPESGSMKTMGDPVNSDIALLYNGMYRIAAIQSARNARTWQQGAQYTFLDLLGEAKDWQCQKPLDKFYGLRELADEDVQKILEPNYKMPFAELSLKFANHWISRDPHFQLFHAISSSELASERHPQHLAYGLPSWCPSFYVPRVATSFWPSGFTAQYRAGVRAGRKTQIRKISDRIIGIEGFLVDRVTQALKCPWERQNYGNAESKARGVAEFLTWERNCLEISRSLYGGNSGAVYGPHQTTPVLRAAQNLFLAFANAMPAEGPDEVPDAHWRTIIANKHGNGQYYSGSGREIFQLAKIELCKRTGTINLLALKEQFLANTPMTVEKSLQVQDYWEAFGSASHGRSFLSTEGGKIGLGPQHTKPGDLICIFYNGGTPYIIRPKQSGNYVLIGESYVHGLMYGEALRGGNRMSDQFFNLE